MTLRTLIIAAAAASLVGLAVSGPASAKANPAHEHASIPFAAIGGIRSWRAPNDRTILIQAENGQWYRADLFAECIGLSTSNAVGFVTDPDLSLTKFGSVLVHGRRCYFKDFVKIAPPSKHDQHEAK